MLRESAARFFAGSDSVRLLRRRRDAGDLASAARGCWDGMVELGFAGILIPEEFGGAGLDSRASVQISEMMGRTLAAGPFLSSAVMAATAILGGDNAVLKAEMLPAIAGGAVVALAIEENARHTPSSIATGARRDGNSYRISGRKTAVIDGAIAGKLIVTARDVDGQLLLLAVDAEAAGVTMTNFMALDSRPFTLVAFANTGRRRRRSIARSIT
jgi:alkylation response protein AidB-like acyl-CoA dehydrogenase